MKKPPDKAMAPQSCTLLFYIYKPIMKSTYLQHYQFKKSITLRGVSGGSGLAYKEGVLYLVSDDSDILYAHDLKTNKLSKISLRKSGELEGPIEKSLKSDFESIGFAYGHYYLFGSGSAKNRFDGAELDADFTFIRRFSVEALFRKMMVVSGIGEEDFNVEGVILKDSSAFFFNRGNGPNRKNGIITVEDWQRSTFKGIDYHPIILPEKDGFPFGFSDAVLINGKVCFLATVEKAASVYDDGEIAGSALGILDMDTFKLTDFHLLTEDYKLEGITSSEIRSDGVKFYLCEDADQGITETHVFELEVIWKKV